ncbi:MAG: chorismate synthase [Candidatus Riflebacteria bacterium]|nr:chorismate synthase [Candidatus Riflebacteria bacterium]
MIRYLTAGESHGPALVGIIEGVPPGIKVSEDDFEKLFVRRKLGYGRSGRTKIETDKVTVLAGITGGQTNGGPIALMIENRDYKAHASHMHPFNEPSLEGRIPVPLPGHADFQGAMKFGFSDCRSVRERASGRETAMRAALSVPARNYLETKGIKFLSFIDALGDVSAQNDYSLGFEEAEALLQLNDENLPCQDAKTAESWRKMIEQAQENGESIGVSMTTAVYGLPLGLGSYTHYDRRLEYALSGAVMSIPGVKGMEIGFGRDLASKSGIKYDSIELAGDAIYKRGSNLSGGIEGGMTTGEILIVRYFMKPLPGNSRASSVNLETGEKAMPAFYRSDVCVPVPLAVAVESVLAIEILKALLCRASE